MAQVYISIGHGGKDPGAVANNTTEHEECRRIGDAVIREAEKRYGFTIGQIPVGMSLQDRIKWINNNILNDKLIIELHMNAASNASAQGAEVYYYDGFSMMKALAEKLLAVYCTKTEIHSRGTYPDTKTRFGRLGFIRDTRPSALLFELCFISNSLDLEKARTKAVLGIVDMLALHYNKTPVNQDPLAKVSSWAEQSVAKAIHKGIMVRWQDPQEIIGNSTLEASLVKLGLLSQQGNVGVSKERWACVLDKLGLLN
jgi:hypothetical protein